MGVGGGGKKRRRERERREVEEEERIGGRLRVEQVIKEEIIWRVK